MTRVMKPTVDLVHAPLVLYVVESDSCAWEVFTSQDEAENARDQVRRLWPEAAVRILLYPRPLEFTWEVRR